MKVMKQERRDKGLYWDHAWKLVEGCNKVSPGCDNCWSEAETAMRSGHPNETMRCRALDVISLERPYGFSGKIKLRTDNLELPLRTKKPTVFAVWNDLWHEDVPLEFITQVFQVMERARKLGHTFLILTKRAERMGCFLSEVGIESPDHIWWGVTAENQQTANERIPHLLRVPGKRFLSIEPMLGPINLNCVAGVVVGHGRFGIDCLDHIHAVLLGGESGKCARPLHPDWVYSIRRQCAATEVPFFFKQWGEYHPLIWSDGGDVCVGREEGYRTVDVGGMTMVRCGKRAAGRVLDGRTHDTLPWDEA